MDRGQIFIGKKLYDVRNIAGLNLKLARYGHRFDATDMRTVRIDGKQTKYEVHYNDQVDFPQEGVIFGIEALAAYENFTEYTAQCKGMKLAEPKELTSGYHRDWIQEFNPQKLIELLAEVRKDIPDASVMIMDLHY